MAYFAHIVNSFYEKILTNFGYIMPNLLYVLYYIRSILLYFDQIFRDFLSLAVNGSFCPHAHTKKDIHRTCGRSCGYLGYMIKSNTLDLIDLFRSDIYIYVAIGSKLSM